jgi:hypothetical protein
MFDLAVDLALDARKLRFDFYFALECEGHCRLPSCAGWHAGFSARQAAAEIVLGDRTGLGKRPHNIRQLCGARFIRGLRELLAGLLSTTLLPEPRPLCYDLAPAKLSTMIPRDIKAKEMIGG